MSENKNYKEYSYLHIFDGFYVDKKKNKSVAFKAVSTSGFVNNLTWVNNNNGGKFLSGSLPINRRTKWLNTALGLSLPETQETIWADVNFRENDASERLMKFKTNGGLKAVNLSHIDGKIYVGKDKNGELRIRISVDSFEIARFQGSKRDGASTAAASAAPKAPAAPTPPASMNQMSGMSGWNNREDDFAELTGDDDNLPF